MLTPKQISKWNKFYDKYVKQSNITSNNIKIYVTIYFYTYGLETCNIKINNNTKLGKQMYDKLEEMGLLK